MRVTRYEATGKLLSRMVSDTAADGQIDVEKSYDKADVIAKLRRLADALEQSRAFEIQIAGERVYMPARATVEFEYQREGDDEEIEIEISWSKDRG